MGYKGTKLDVMVGSVKGVTENKDRYVRMNVAANSSTPPEPLTQLAEDKSSRVKQAARTNPTYLHHRAVQDGICKVGQLMPVEWLKEMYF